MYIHIYRKNKLENIKNIINNFKMKIGPCLKNENI